MTPRCQGDLVSPYNQAPISSTSYEITTMSSALSATGKWLEREFSAAWPAFLFFLAGFLIELLIIKLAVEKYSVEVTAVPTAIVAALLDAKAGLLIDETPLRHSLHH